MAFLHKWGIYCCKSEEFILQLCPISLCTKQILTGDMGLPKKIIVFSRDETKQHDMRMSYLQKKVIADEVIHNNFMNVLEFRIGDVRSYADVCSAVKNVDIVINAAAVKHVPICEYFPNQALLTNCIGAENIVRAIHENDYPVQTVVGISTDKACKPISVMGMTKSLQERIFIAANILNSATRYICVRLGNVLASRGSVIPLFHKQILNGGPVTVTVPEMTRFLLSLNQAVDTVFAALQYAKRGETFVPNAPSARVIDIAKALIGDREIEIKIIGIRPAEKIHEIIVSDEEANHSVKYGDYYVIRPMLPELFSAENIDEYSLTKGVSSGDMVLDLEGTMILLENHNLMIDKVQLGTQEELIRL